MNKSNSKQDKKLDTTFDDVFEQQSLEAWQAIAEKSLRGESLDSLSKNSAGGLATRALYSERPASTSQLPSPPLQNWDNRLSLLEASPKEQNQRLLDGLNGGIRSVQLNVDKRQQHYALSLDDLAAVTQNVQLELVPISLKPGTAFTDGANRIAALWEAHGISDDQAQGAINADPVGTLAATGQTSDQLDAQLSQMSELTQQWHARFPNVTTVCVDTTSYHNAGASIEQELISSVATAAIYLSSMVEHGLDITTAHNSLVFQVACDADTIANIVKLRSLKKLLHHVASQMGVQQPVMQLVAETSRRMQSRQTPWVNHLRNISAAAAAAMAGAQSIVVHPHNHIDGAFIDDDKNISTRVARNIAIILSEESNMTFVNDPMSGAYAIETLCSELSDKVWQRLQQLEKDGGLVEQLNTGKWQQDIAEYQKQRVARLHASENISIGVNKFQASPKTEAPIQNKPSSPAIPASALRTQRDAVEFEVSA